MQNKLSTKVEVGSSLGVWTLNCLQFTESFFHWMDCRNGFYSSAYCVQRSIYEIQRGNMEYTDVVECDVDRKSLKPIASHIVSGCWLLRWLWLGRIIWGEWRIATSMCSSHKFYITRFEFEIFWRISNFSNFCASSWNL